MPSPARIARQANAAPALSKRIAEVIAGLKREGLSILVSDLQHSASMLDRVFRIERGEVSVGSPGMSWRLESNRAIGG